jgi:SNF2 family DNA or RNA helicase
MALKITLSLEGAFAVIRIRGFLGERFGDYRKAIEGAIYNAKAKANYATIDKVPGIIVRLREADFGVDCDEALTRALAEHTTQLWNDVQAAKERARAFDEAMQERVNPKTGKPYYLYPFQHSGISWLSMKFGALLADDMGLGKTIQTIAAMPANAAVLVVGPAVAKSVWRKELGDWRPHLRVSVLSGRGTFRWPKAGEVVITNYDILPNTHTDACLEARKDKKTKLEGQHDKNCLKAQGNIFVPALQALAKTCKGCLKRCDVAKECTGCLPFLKEVPDNVVMVFDEAHNLKNGNAQRTVRARGLSGAVRAKGGRVWLLTATPLMNHPVELWSVFQAALIAQEVFGDFKTFLRLFNAKAASEFGGYLFGTPETEEIAERMQRVMLRRMKKDVLQELPAKDWRTVTVEVDQKALKACDAYVAKFGGVDKIAETLDKTLDFKTMSMVASALAAAKIPAMLDLVESYEEQEEPLVVFSAHRAPIDVLAKRPGWGVITGDTTNEERGRLVEQFQAGDLKGMGCTIRAGGVAVTLTRSCNMVFVDREWTPALNVQAEDRISRIGQDRPVLITILVADHPLDERVTELTTAKQMLINASVDGAREMQDHDEELAGTGS